MASCPPKRCWQRRASRAAASLVEKTKELNAVVDQTPEIKNGVIGIVVQKGRIRERIVVRSKKKKKKKNKQSVGRNVGR